MKDFTRENSGFGSAFYSVVSAGYHSSFYRGCDLLLHREWRGSYFVGGEHWWECTGGTSKNYTSVFKSKGFPSVTWIQSAIYAVLAVIAQNICQSSSGTS